MADVIDQLTLGSLFEDGLKLRREVLGAE